MCRAGWPHPDHRLQPRTRGPPCALRVGGRLQDGLHLAHSEQASAAVVLLVDGGSTVVDDGDALVGIRQQRVARPLLQRDRRAVLGGQVRGAQPHRLGEVGVLHRAHSVPAADVVSRVVVVHALVEHPAGRHHAGAGLGGRVGRVAQGHLELVLKAVDPLVHAALAQPVANHPDLDVAVLAPANTPAVPDQPVALSHVVADDHHGVVAGSGAHAVVNGGAVAREVGRDVERDGHGAVVHGRHELRLGVRLASARVVRDGAPVQLHLVLGVSGGHHVWEGAGGAAGRHHAQRLEVGVSQAPGAGLVRQARQRGVVHDVVHGAAVAVAGGAAHAGQALGRVLVLVLGAAAERGLRVRQPDVVGALVVGDEVRRLHDTGSGK
mmetsp:Transcript_21949/g.55885  ORF Transcript_21949/g.55885 Transcript_21949/m.55885 type:complete len:379 (-) Transcript_21949:1329-2465(-)